MTQNGAKPHTTLFRSRREAAEQFVTQSKSHYLDCHRPRSGTSTIRSSRRQENHSDGKHLDKFDKSESRYLDCYGSRYYAREADLFHAGDEVALYARAGISRELEIDGPANLVGFERIEMERHRVAVDPRRVSRVSVFLPFGA